MNEEEMLEEMFAISVQVAFKNKQNAYVGIHHAASLCFAVSMEEAITVGRKVATMCEMQWREVLSLPLDVPSTVTINISNHEARKDSFYRKQSYHEEYQL